MVRSLGIIFAGILIAMPAIFAEMFIKNGFLLSFAQNQSVGVMATMLAINVAVVTFIVGTLLTIEARANKTLFENTRKELLENIIFMAVLFLTNFTAVAFNHAGFGFMLNGVYVNVTFLLSSLTAILLVLNVVAMYEIIQAIFQLKNFFANDTPKKK